ncbi:unnamed protein product, partial [Sphenostylis stenocarpa]
MGVEKGEEIKPDEACTSENPAETRRKKEMDEGREKEKEKTQTVPFHKLFAFADSTDTLLMIVGSIGSIGNGVALPLMTLLLGQVIDKFHTGDQNSNLLEQVSKVCLKFVYLALGAGIGGIL